MLNKQNPDKIDWTDYTWNPISGCLHGCSYCYMKRMEKRFSKIMRPLYRPTYLTDIKKIKNPSKIFVGSSGDMWGEWVLNDWVEAVLDVVKDFPQHQFQFLTKNPKRYADFNLPENGIYGTTVDGTKKTADNLKILCDSTFHWNKAFVSFEPLLRQIPFSIAEGLQYVDWVIIGANSNKGAEKPPLHWAGMLIALCKSFAIPVFVKNNYNYPEKFKEMPFWNSKTSNPATK